MKFMNMSERAAAYLERITNEKKEAFGAFYRLLIEYNQKYNLTAITEEKAVFYKHFLDSALGEFLFPPHAKVLEVGSGAGFPSLVLKILRPDLSFTLTDGVGKKCAFLQAACAALGLQGVEVIHARAEDLARDGKYRGKYDISCARAVAAMNTLSEYCLPFVRVGGRFIAYKGGDETEIENAANAVRLLGGRVKEVIGYDLPEGYGGRTLAVIEKVRPTPARYPRGNGRERKDPL